MNTKRRSVFYLLIAVTLLLFAFCLFACNDNDFYELYGTPQQLAEVTPASDGGTQPNKQQSDAAPSTDDLAPDSGDKASGPSATDDDPATGGNASSNDQTPTGSQPPTGEQSSSDDGTVTGGNSADGNGNDGAGDDVRDGDGKSDPPADGDGVTEKEPTTEGDGTVDPEGGQDGEGQEAEERQQLLEQTFDLTVERDGLYRYNLYLSAKEVPVYVGMQNIGTATLTEDGTVCFDCDFIVAEREVWGNCDQEYHLTAYVLFEEFSDPFKQIVYRPEIAFALQIDLTAEEVAALRDISEPQNGGGSVDPEDPEDVGGDPQPQDPIEDPVEPKEPEQSGDQGDPEEPPADPQSQGEEQGGGQAPEDPVGADEPPQVFLPKESAIADIWEGLGALSDVQVVVVTGEEEEYSFRLCGTAEEYDVLIGVLTPYLTYSDHTVTPEQYQATALIEGKVFNLFVQITKEDAAYTADVKVLGEAL